MKSLMVLVSAVLLLPACGGAKSDQLVRDPQAAQKVAQARERWNLQQKEFESAPEDHRKKCEMKAGDCLMQIDEHRNDFVANNYIAQCRDLADNDEESECVAQSLAADGQPKAPVEYYGFGAWCYQKLNECTAALAVTAVEDARLARIEFRRDEIEFSGEGIAARAAVTYAQERINYIRSTLPPKGDGLCAEEAVRSQCEATAKIKQERFEAKLDGDDQQYDHNGALQLYREAHESEASCYEPEFHCLEANLVRFGEMMASKKSLEKNLDRLQRREFLRAQVDSTASEQCLMEGVSKHQASIIDDYQAYVQQPVMFFRDRLHRAFLQLHQSQIRCLEKAANESKAARSPKLVPADGKAGEQFGG